MLRRGGLAYRQGKGGPKTVEDHCGKAGRSKVNRLLAKQTRLFSYIEVERSSGFPTPPRKTVSDWG